MPLVSGATISFLPTFIFFLFMQRYDFSSRTPILYSEASLQMIEHSGLNPEDNRKILGENAAKLLKLIG